MGTLTEPRAEVGPLRLSAVESRAVDWAARRLADALGQVPLSELVDAADADLDVSTQIPFPIGVPAMPLLRAGLALLLRAGDVRIWEAIRLRLCAHIPAHGRVLGSDRCWPWYIRTMEGLRARLLAELAGQEGMP